MRAATLRVPLSALADLQATWITCRHGDRIVLVLTLDHRASTTATSCWSLDGGVTFWTTTTNATGEATWPRIRI